MGGALTPEAGVLLCSLGLGAAASLASKAVWDGGEERFFVLRFMGRSWTSLTWAGLKIEFFIWILGGVFLGWAQAPDSLFPSAMGGMVGAVLFWVRDKGRRAREKDAIKKEFPIFLELLAMNLTAGLSFTESWSRASSFLPLGSLKNKTRAIARHSKKAGLLERGISDWEESNSIPELAGPLALIRNALERGGQVSAALRAQAQALKARRAIEFEESALTLGTRLLFPIMLLIAPALFISIFAPIFYFMRTRGFLF